CPVCDAKDSTDSLDASSVDESAGSVSDPSESDQSDRWSKLTNRIAPWLTPLGGLVLVGAHVMNRRFGCLCGCCETAIEPQNG
ncbi:MAG: MerC domain-containing protein, partial [Planctomycetota bacterium]